MADFDPTDDLAQLERAIGYGFDDRRLLERALTHRSFVNENDDVDADNQRLEFLGDAVLGLVTAEELFRRFPGVGEGFMSSLQANLVCEAALCEIARAIDLGRHLRLGKGEDMSGGREKASVLADAYEALLAAIFLDSGLDAVRTVILGLHEDALDAGEPAAPPEDHKSRLQRLVQRDAETRPQYEIVEELGPAHARVFVAEVRVEDQTRGAGRGRSKKEAEQRAAYEALKQLDPEQSG